MMRTLAVCLALCACGPGNGMNPDGTYSSSAGIGDGCGPNRGCDAELTCRGGVCQTFGGATTAGGADAERDGGDKVAPISMESRDDGGWSPPSCDFDAGDCRP